MSLLLLLFSCRLDAEELVCHWANGPIDIDGKASEVAWKSASVIDTFRIPGSLTTRPMTSTRARVLWDREFLYFFAELEDHDLFADVVTRDGKTWDNDVFEMFFKPSQTESGYYEFQVNAAGTEMDLFLPDQQSGGYDALKSSHLFHWKSAVQRNGTLNLREDRDESWSVEGKIPWIDFMHTGGRPDVDEVWSLALCRYDYTRGKSPELSSCAPLTKANFHRYQDYAQLRFAGASESVTALKKIKALSPYVDSKVVGSPEPPLPYRAVRAFPELKLEWPIDVQIEPGSKRMVLIEEQGSYGPTKVMRTKGDGSGELELLVDPKGVAYSIAFHPKFLQNGFMYIGSNGTKEGEKTKSRIVRHTLSRTPPYEVVGEPQTVIDWDSAGHNGAAITFGRDGMMYVTSGDGTSDSDANVTGQDLSKLLAKVLRIDVDHPADGLNYSIPEDNPFLTTPHARPETWAYGLRNPWRITTDRKSGQIWVGNNGQDMWEQVYLIEKGANYGWSVFEGSHPFYSKRTLGPTPHIKPTLEHPHSESRSLTGGVVYYGSKLPELQGAYIYGDYSTGKIWGVKHDGDKVQWHREIADTPYQISAISIDSDGELLIVDHHGDRQGGLYHLEPTPVDSKPNRFPRLLSETGLFKNIPSHLGSEGHISYTINAPFWSDGAIKSRFIALPADGQIELTDQWAWQFPEQTVIVKSFALETIAGDTGSRKWIETRLLTKQQGEWVGYSYEWNDDQTDATLVEAAGRDTQFTIDEAAGKRIFPWRYPSRTECMVCHTRASGYLLGLSTIQMNKVHDYGDGIKANQIETLETLGVLKTNWVPQAQNALRVQLKNEGKSSEAIESDVKSLRVGKGQRSVRSNKLLGVGTLASSKLIDPYDEQGDLALRARSFLHSNCGYCHVEAGGGNAKMDLSFYAELSRMNLIDAAPIHHTFDKTDARLIAPGSIDRSVLLHRVGMRGPGQMPQLATTLVDQQALKMLKAWVESMK